MDLLQQPPPPPAVELQLPPGQPNDVNADVDMGDIGDQPTQAPTDKFESTTCIALDALHSAVSDFRFQLTNPEKEQHYSILDHWGEAACCFVDTIRVGLAALKDVGMVSLDASDLVCRELQNASANYPPPGDTLDYGPLDVDVQPSMGYTQWDNITSTILTALQPLL
ncbi:hypothetical protein WOLCODRAFT_147554 [Wolfiporia cocos MD-104 SS10]|uniref:Uncharacterized protein n=1 Tax=Wolfiporia cocos (strain MD-104) TaxID=742152 RepID=A0A2H3J738_WOLCO|nr:hypothetical protein WOLCODRAFT_147554 [Wolfiporia cocos MD-104 SS10]